MALIHGKRANIIWDGGDTRPELKHGQSWTLDVIHDVAEISAMQDTWKTYNAGFQDWTATVECIHDSVGPEIGLGGDDGMADDETRLELYVIFEGGNYRGFYGTAICTGISPSLDKDSAATVTYTFQGVAQIVWYSDTVVVP